MQSYLAFPGSALELVKGYSDGRGHRSELDNVTQLQRQFWLLKNIEYMVMKIEEIEQTEKGGCRGCQRRTITPKLNIHDWIISSHVYFFAVRE